MGGGGASVHACSHAEEACMHASLYMWMCIPVEVCACVRAAKFSAHFWARTTVLRIAIPVASCGIIHSGKSEFILTNAIVQVFQKARMKRILF